MNAFNEDHLKFFSNQHNIKPSLGKTILFPT
jgi:hypothetical protein